VRILVVNAGSTSTKLRVVEPDDRVAYSVDLHPTSEGLTDHLGRFLAEAGRLDATGHRLVHGGPRFTRPVVVDDSVRRALDALNNLAPLHNPEALVAVDAVRRVAPDIPTVACFDTAFHASLHEEATTYALPAAWVERGGLRRYGFHGLSCEWSVRRAAALLERPVATLRLVICHLGGGASVTAVSGGRSVDTTMGFTPTEGLVMATRPGDVDPGAIAWLAAHGVTPAELVDGLERRSGLLALTGTGDMRALLQRRAAGEPAATHALYVYLHRLRAKIAAMCAATDGTDVLVFTGGVGERASEIRAAVCERLGWLGISVAADLNRAVEADDADISGAGAPVRTLVIHAREELVIAAGCRAVLGGPA
jgi:acetate kinase